MGGVAEDLASAPGVAPSFEYLFNSLLRVYRTSLFLGFLKVVRKVC